MQLPVDTYITFVIHIGGNATESEISDRAVQRRFPVRNAGAVLLVVEWVSIVRTDWKGVELVGPIFVAGKIDECSLHLSRNIMVDAG